MKNNFKIALLFLAVGLPCAAYAGFAAFSVPAAFNGEIVFSILAIAGLQLVTLGDSSRRRAIAPTNVVELRPAVPAVANVAPLGRRSHGLRRRERMAA